MFETIEQIFDRKIRAFRQQLITEWQGQFTPAAHDILDHTGFPGGTTDYLRGDGSFATPPGGGTPSATVAALDGTGAAGSSTDYSRGDHKHADANRPSDDEKDALVGTDGTPSAANPFVTDSDPRFAGAGDCTRLAQIITASSQATVDFTSISGAYTSLLILFQSRDTEAGTSGQLVRVKLNNDATSGNYRAAQRIGGQNGSAYASTIAASTGGAFVCAHPQDGNTAGITAAGTLWIVNYAGTAFFKRLLSEAGYFDGTFNGNMVALTTDWLSAAAVSRVTFTTDGTAFKDGLVFTLYGFK